MERVVHSEGLTMWIKKDGKILKKDGKIAIDLSCCCDCVGCVPCPDWVRLTMHATGACSIWDGKICDVATNGICTSFAAFLTCFDAQWANFQWFDAAGITFQCCDTVNKSKWCSYLRANQQSPCLVFDVGYRPVLENSCSPLHLRSQNYSIGQFLGNCGEPCDCFGIGDPCDGVIWFTADGL